MNAYIAQIRMNLRLTFRDRTVLFFNYVFPLIFFFIFGQLMHADQGGVIVMVVTMVLTLGILASGLFGAGMRIVSDREQSSGTGMRIESVIVGVVGVEVIAGLTEVDVFKLGADGWNRAHPGNRLPRRLMIVEIPGKPIRGVVASDRGITYAGTKIESGGIVRQGRR